MQGICELAGQHIQLYLKDQAELNPKVFVVGAVLVCVGLVAGPCAKPAIACCLLDRGKTCVANGTDPIIA